MFIVPLTHPSLRFARQVTADDGARSPALDVAETDTGYEVVLDVPGVAKEDVKVSIEGRRVTVQAENGRLADKKDGDRLVYRERAAARFARTFTLPAELDQASSGARLDNGVLTLTLAKRTANGGSQITVN